MPINPIKNLNKIPSTERNLVERGLSNALRKKKLGGIPIDFIQIENFLSGGKTGAVVFVASYGLDKAPENSSKSVKSKISKKKTPLKSESQKSSSFIRVLKVAPKEVCESENEGYEKTRETLLDIFSQVEYKKEDEFKMEDNSTYGILLYQNVGTIAVGDLKGISKYFNQTVLHPSEENRSYEKIGKELSLLLQKEVFYGLKKGLYGDHRKIIADLSEYYGDKLKSESVKNGLLEISKLDPDLPGIETILNFFNKKSSYYSVNYIHGDLNPENILIWEDDRNLMKCKLIDFGEVMLKKKDNFTPLFWDFSRLMGEMILNFFEEILESGSERFSSEVDPGLRTRSVAVEFLGILRSYLIDQYTKIDNPKNEYMTLVRVYLTTLFDFLNESRSGMRDLKRPEVLRDYLHSQICFFLFFSKFNKESIQKRYFSLLLAIDLQAFLESEEGDLKVSIQSLEKSYFTFGGNFEKDRKPVIGPPEGSRSPYMGLSYFQEKDREYFFGREKIIIDLINAIEGYSVVALAGPSGSGKSSIVHAGVIPYLKEKQYMVFKFRPGINPTGSAIHSLGGGETLRDSVYEQLRKYPDRKLFLLGDQFEEIFTQSGNSEDINSLMTNIMHCIREFGSRFKFLLTIRADFWSRLLEERGFAQFLTEGDSGGQVGRHFFLLPMKTEELRSAIESPLKIAGLQIQEGLTDLILTSVVKEPGSLPLLEFCLEELWKTQVDYTLTYEAYKAIGEVRGALATYAEEVYFQLNESERTLMKKLMLQLIQPGQGTEDTRRIAILDDLINNQTSTNGFLKGKKTTPDKAESSGEVIRDFIQKIAGKRLIVTGENEEGKSTIEVVHEALIREWKRLREWIHTDREFRIWQEKIRAFQKEWDENNREEVLLLSGSNLMTSLEWMDQRSSDLSQKDFEYIDLSQKNQQKKRIKFWSVSGVLMTVILGFAIFGAKNYFRAEEKELEVVKQTNISEDREKQIQEALKVLDSKQKELDKQTLLLKEKELLVKKIEEKTEKLKQENQTKEESLKEKKKEIDTITEKIAKGFSLKKEELLHSGEIDNWSEYQGKLNWTSANKKCSSLGRGWRLPKRGEWQVNFGTNKSKLKKSWIVSEFGEHWTSESYSPGRMYTFIVDFGDVSHGPKSITKHVRCIH